MVWSLFSVQSTGTQLIAQEHQLVAWQLQDAVPEHWLMLKLIISFSLHHPKAHTNHCRGIILLLVLKHRVHSSIDRPLSLSRSQSFNNFLLHFLPLFIVPRCFFMADVRNSLDKRSLSLFLSKRLNFQINTWWSESFEPRYWRSPDLALLRSWFLIEDPAERKHLVWINDQNNVCYVTVQQMQLWPSTLWY